MSRPRKILPVANPPGVVTIPLEKPEESTIPPCPEANPMQGDKTPAVVAWWFEHQPRLAALKYAGRKIQLPNAND